MMVDESLIRKINSGRCFAFIGAGASCEMGYPSWEQLASALVEEIKRKCLVSDQKSYDKYLREKKFPELFGLAERDIADRRAFIEIIKSLIEPASKMKGYGYEILSNWPFACYLTTNFDNEIKYHLEKIGFYFTVIYNSLDDCSFFRDSAAGVIQKLHSDLEHPLDAVLTDKDYEKLYIHDSKNYFSIKLRQIFEMFDILIIGYSLSDYDIQHILRLAKTTANPSHPIYMISHSFTKAEEIEYFDKYNIRLIRYNNDDGTHSELKSLLKTMDKFIVPRKVNGIGLEIGSPSEEEIETVTSLFLYRRLQGLDGLDYVSPVILSILNKKKGGITFEEISATPLLSTQRLSDSVHYFEALENAMQSLIASQYVKKDSGGNYIITESGSVKVAEYNSIRNIEKDQAYGQFEITLKTNCPSVIADQINECKKIAEAIILSSFQKRGLTIARQIYLSQSANSSELVDLFGIISRAANKFSSNELKLAFITSMHQFLIEPNPSQKKYLASVSQGFFLYHLLGLDPKCIQIRKGIFQDTLWFCDSSVIIPFIAIGCQNHGYASSLFIELKNAKASLFTTQNLLKETFDHYNWASDFIKKHSYDSPEFLKAALSKGNYKQNLFLDGYIRMNADGFVSSFSEYSHMIFPDGKIQNSITKRLTDAGFQFVDLPSIEGFCIEDYGDFECAKDTIKSERLQKNTFRSELQVESEAEIWCLINGLHNKKYYIKNQNNEFEHFYFISLSRLLDRIFKIDGVCTWTPEAVYRYLATMPGTDINPDLLQQCMLHEFYFAGISVIDKEKYSRFFGPYIDASKQKYESEKSAYIASIEGDSKKFENDFNNTPDLEKPFFTSQMGWKVAETARKSEERAVQQKNKAETQLRELQAEKDRAWKARKQSQEKQEEARRRNENDPKHLRKKFRQAKKRRKKK